MPQDHQRHIYHELYVMREYMRIQADRLVQQLSVRGRIRIFPLRGTVDIFDITEQGSHLHVPERTECVFL